MKNYIYSIIVLFLLSINVYGASPNWSVNENKFQYTMTFVGFLSVDGVTLSSPGDQVAAFVGDECRGVARLMYVESQNKYYVYLTVFSNQNNEAISFKIYNARKDEIKDVAKTKNFTINENYGNLFQAYSFASPSLSPDAKILNIDFKDVQKKDISIQGSTITIYVGAEADTKTMNAIFQLSPGSTVYMGGVKQTSGSNSLNFTNPVELQVMSEDQSVVNLWTIIVKKGSGNVVYYKKDAVCYEGGSIKVLFPKENETISLMSGTLTIATQIVTNGQAIFNNLNSGTYKVLAGGEVKEIVINLKK